MEQKKKELLRKKKQMRRFLEEEAELGSDDEENDDVRKDINRNDEDENDEDLDSDLEGFVVRGDDEEIADPTEDMYVKHQKDMEALDRLQIQQTMQAVLFGQNRKRKRGEVEGLDLDENSKRKLQLKEERMNQLRGINSQDDMVDLTLSTFNQQRNLMQ